MFNTARYILNKNNNNICYATLNRFSPVNGKLERRPNCLSGIECICLDIDIKNKGNDLEDCLRYREWELVDFLMAQNKKALLPTPNAVSFTGTGGIHLYWKINRTSRKAIKLVNFVKYELAECIAQLYHEMDEYMLGVEYRVDMASMDTQRLDRVPGSVHPETNRVCEFYILYDYEYNIKDLAAILCQDRLRYDYAIQNMKYRISRYEKGYSVGLYKPLSKKHKKIYTWTPEYLGKQRMEEMYRLAKSNYGFYNCRELACFMMRVFCRDQRMNDNQINYHLHKLNTYFYAPLKENEIQGVLRQKAHYNFTNETIRQKLLLSYSDGFFCGAKIKKNKHQEIIEEIKKILALVAKGFKIKEIAQKLDMNESKVKRLKLCSPH